MFKSKWGLLIGRKIAGTLTSEERVQLETMTKYADAYIDRITPRDTTIRALLTPTSATPEVLRPLTSKKAAACPELTDDQIREALNKGWDESGFGDHNPAAEKDTDDGCTRKPD